MIKFTNTPLRWVHFVTGCAHITVDATHQEAWIWGGRYGMLWAGDPVHLSKHGHSTEYPCSDESITLAMMSPYGIEPEHKIIREGQCLQEDMLGL